MDKIITRIFHVSLPLSLEGIRGSFQAVSDVVGVDLGDGKRYRFKDLKIVSSKNCKRGCTLKRKNPDTGAIESYKMKEAHFEQKVEASFEELATNEPSGLMDNLTK